MAVYYDTGYNAGGWRSWVEIEEAKRDLYEVTYSVEVKVRALANGEDAEGEVIENFHPEADSNLQTHAYVNGIARHHSVIGEKDLSAGSVTSVSSFTFTHPLSFATAVSMAVRVETTYGSNTNVVSFTLSAPRSEMLPPRGPMEVSAERVDDGHVTVSWDDAGTDDSPWLIYNVDWARGSRTEEMRETLWQSDRGSSVTLELPESLLGTYAVFYVQAFNKAGESSPVGSNTVLGTPEPPLSVVASAASTTSVRLRLSGITGDNPVHHWLVRRKTAGGDEEIDGEFPAATSIVVDAETGVTASYGVRAVNADGLESSVRWSNEVNTATVPEAPEVSVSPAHAPAGGVVTVEWAPRHPDGSEQTLAEVSVEGPGSFSRTVEVEGAATSATVQLGEAGTYLVTVRTQGVEEKGLGAAGAAAAVAHDAPAVTVSSPADGSSVSSLPMSVAWSVDADEVVTSVTVDVLEGERLLLRRSAASSPYPVTARDLQLEDGSEYRVRVTARTEHGLEGSGESSVTAALLGPAVPSCEVSPDPGTLSCDVTVRAGSGGAVPTAYLSLSRVLADGTATTVAGRLADGDAVRDALAPLNEPFSYVVTAHSDFGSTASSAEAAAVEAGPTWVYGFGDGTDPSRVVALEADPSSSETVEASGELYRFAGAALPSWYGTGGLDAAVSQSFNVDSATADRLRSLVRSGGLCWVRDPMGHLWRCRPSLSLTALFGSPIRYEASISMTEVAQ